MKIEAKSSWVVSKINVNSPCNKIIIIVGRLRGKTINMILRFLRSMIKYKLVKTMVTNPTPNTESF